MKKQEGQETHSVPLARNPDILATIAQAGPNRPPLVIGFAAETENVIENAISKRQKKNADWIVANDVSPATGIMGGDATRIHLVTEAGVEDWQPMGKDEMAEALLRRAAGTLSGLRSAAE
jgi:phosphopantothenoylcysteine decarboxylase/phosphopantothenate--cysteine ligase